MGDHPGEEDEKKPLPQEDSAGGEMDKASTQNTRGEGKEVTKGGKTPK